MGNGSLNKEEAEKAEREKGTTELGKNEGHVSTFNKWLDCCLIFLR